MSVSRYIDIDSTYRDRITYPKVGDFVLQVNSTTRQGLTYTYNPNNSVTINSAPPAATASDPVSLSFPTETDRTSGGSTITAVVLSPLSSNIYNYYAGDVINIDSSFSTITAYDNTTNVVTISPALAVAPVALTPYYIRTQYPTAFTNGARQDTLLVNTPNTTDVILGANAYGIDNFYTGQYVFFPVIGAGPPSPAQFIWKLVLGYTGATKYAVCVNTSNLTPAIIPSISGGVPTVYQMLPFSYDNSKSLNYNGTQIFNNPVCERLRLVNLIVPNQYVVGSYGGTLQNYPYLYVSLYSDKGNTCNSPIESNYPVARKSLFKVPVSFLPNNNWLTLQGSFMSQTISFRENDALHFTVYLPDGTILDFLPNNQYTYFEQYKFPVSSDPSNQIQAVFEVVR